MRCEAGRTNDDEVVQWELADVVPGLRLSQPAPERIRTARSQGLRVSAVGAYGRRMLILVIVLLVLWLILSVVGFAIKGLFWLAVIGIILFLATLLIGIIRRRAGKSKTVV